MNTKILAFGFGHRLAIPARGLRGGDGSDDPRLPDGGLTRTGTPLKREQLQTSFEGMFNVSKGSSLLGDQSSVITASRAPSPFSPTRTPALLSSTRPACPISAWSSRVTGSIPLARTPGWCACSSIRRKWRRPRAMARIAHSGHGLRSSVPTVRTTTSRPARLNCVGPTS